MSTGAPSLAFPHRHLLGIEGLSPDEITLLLDRSESYVEQNRQVDKKQSLLRGRTIINLFFENSTRTRTSFELAGKRLGGDVINMSVQASSIKKGETLIDTAMTLERHASRRAGRASSRIGRGAAPGREGRLRRHQRRRRQPRAPDPGAARRADHPPPQGPPPGPDRGHLRRHPAQPGRALQHRAAQHHGRAGARGGAAHAAAGRDRAARRRGVPRHGGGPQGASTSS